MSDPSDIKYAEDLLRRDLMEWRDAGGAVESVTGSILRLIVAREAFATMVKAEQEPPCCEGPAKMGPGWHSPTCKNVQWSAQETVADEFPLRCKRTAFVQGETRRCVLDADHEDSHQVGRNGTTPYCWRS